MSVQNTHLPREYKSLDSLEVVKDCLNPWSQSMKGSATHKIPDYRKGPNTLNEADYKRHQFTVFDKPNQIGLRIFENNKVLRDMWIEKATGKHYYTKGEGYNGTTYEEFNLHLNLVDNDKKEYRMEFKLNTMINQSQYHVLKQSINLYEKSTVTTNSYWHDQPIIEDHFKSII